MEIITLITVIANIAGVVGFFCRINYLLVIGGLAYIIETIAQKKRGALQNNAIFMTLFFCVIAAVVSYVRGYNIFYGICFALALEGSIFALPALIMIILSIIGLLPNSFQKRKQRLQYY